MTTEAVAKKEVARASLIQYTPTHLQVRVVVGKEEEWKQPNPELDIWEAYADRPQGGIEAYLLIVDSEREYLLIVDSEREIKPADPSTWQGLQGKIIEAFYSPKAEFFVPKWWATNSPRVEGRSVGIPTTILTAAGIDRQAAFNVSLLNLERPLSPIDLAYVRANCSR